MGELHGRPDPPDPPPERPRAERPDTPASPSPRPHDRPSGTTNDPRAIRDAMRRSEDFAPPDVRRPPIEVRYVADRHTSTDPARAQPHRTTRDRPTPAPERPDGPAHRPPDLIPPRGDELAERDAPGASRLDRTRKKLLDAETLDNEQGLVHDWGEWYDEAVLRHPPPPTCHAEIRPRQEISETPHQGLNTADTLTAMFVTGILIGETARIAYRKSSELRENWHGRNG